MANILKQVISNTTCIKSSNFIEKYFTIIYSSYEVAKILSYATKLLTKVLCSNSFVVINLLLRMSVNRHALRIEINKAAI